MSGGFGAGLAQSLQSEQKLMHDEAVEDMRVHDEQNLNAAQTQSITDADTRAQQLQPGAVDEQQARIDQTTAGTAATKQATDQSSKTFPDEQKQKHYQMLQEQLGLNDTEMANTHNAALGFEKAVSSQVTDGSKVDTGALEQSYNQGAAPGMRIKPGSLNITPDTKNPGMTQISYIGDDGRPRVTTLQNWTDLANSYMPPTKGEVVGPDQRVVDPFSGRTITPATTDTPVGKTDPTAWTAQAARQVATNNGGIFDENGNLKMMDPKLTTKVGKLAGVTGEIGKQTGYAMPATSVAAAVQTVADGGLDPDDPKFVPAVMAKLNAPGYGASQNAPAAAPGAGKYQDAPMDATQRTVGTTYNTPKGPLTWTANGWLPPSP